MASGIIRETLRDQRAPVRVWARAPTLCRQPRTRSVGRNAVCCIKRLSKINDRGTSSGPIADSAEDKGKTEDGRPPILRNSRVLKNSSHNSEIFLAALVSTPISFH